MTLIILAVTSCSHNQNPPDHVKTFTVYKEGDNAFVAYMILADKAGDETTVASQVELIFDIKYKDGSGYAEIKKESFNVTPNDFKPVNIGTGIFKHEGLVCELGRYPLDDFKAKTGKRLWDEYTDVALPYGRAKVRVLLQNGDVLEGETTLAYN